MRYWLIILHASRLSVTVDFLWFASTFPADFWIFVIELMFEKT